MYVDALRGLSITYDYHSQGQMSVWLNTLTPEPPVTALL